MKPPLFPKSLFPLFYPLPCHHSDVTHIRLLLLLKVFQVWLPTAFNRQPTLQGGGQEQSFMTHRARARVRAHTHTHTHTPCAPSTGCPLLQAPVRTLPFLPLPSSYSTHFLRLSSGGLPSFLKPQGAERPSPSHSVLTTLQHFPCFTKLLGVGIWIPHQIVSSKRTRTMHFCGIQHFIQVLEHSMQARHQTEGRCFISRL